VPTYAEQDEVYERISEYLHAQGKILLLFDLREAGPVDRKHRAAAAEWWRKAPLQSIALAHFGMIPVVRVLLSLMNRAVGLLSPTQPRIELFATESEARAWLDRVKAELRPFER
jgi:hypothetical protein